MSVVPIEVYEILEKKLGHEDAKQLLRVMEQSLAAIEEKSRDVAFLRKLEAKEELKDELMDELATKQELARVEGSLREEIAKFEGRLREEMAKLEGRLREEMARIEGRLELKIAHLDKKFTVMFVVLLFAILFVNKDALTWFAAILNLAK